MPVWTNHIYIYISKFTTISANIECIYEVIVRQEQTTTDVAEPEHAEAEAYSLECACVQKPDAYCKAYVYMYIYFYIYIYT